MTPHRLEWHLKFGARLAFWLLKSIESPVRGHDSPTGRGADLDALAFECRMDAILAKKGIPLEFADFISDLERRLAYSLVRLWLRI